MQTRLIHILVHALFIIFFWLSLSGASAMPVPAPLPTLTPAAAPPPLPQPSDYPSYMALAQSYNLRFKKYQEWVKSRSKTLWSSREKLKSSSEKPYVSPYLSRFAEKQSGSVSWRVFWAHLMYETIPEWWRGSEPVREDVFLLRAMEQPLYMSVDELPPEFVRGVGAGD